MTSPNPLRKAAILITALDMRSADALLDQMPEAQAARIRNAVFELDEIDPAEQQQILSEFLRSTGRSAEASSHAEPAAPRPRAASAHVELHLSSAAHAAPNPPSSHPAAAPLVPVTVESYSNPFAAEAPSAATRPLHFLSEHSGYQLAGLLQGEHPQTIAVVVAHLPPQRAAELIDELPSALQAEVLRRVADLAAADPQAIEEIEQVLRRSFHATDASISNHSAGITTVSSILAAAGSSRENMLRNIREHAPRLSQRIGHVAPPASVEQSPFTRADAWSQPVPATSSSSDRMRDLSSEIEAHRRLARAARQLPEQPTMARVDHSQEPSQEKPLVHHEPAVAWDFADLNQLSDADLARVLQAAQSELTMVALAGAEPSFVARLTSQLPPAMARQFSHRIENIGPLKLRDIEAAQQQIATIAAELAEQGKIVQKPARAFAMAA